MIVPCLKVEEVSETSSSNNEAQIRDMKLCVFSILSIIICSITLFGSYISLNVLLKLRKKRNNQRQSIYFFTYK